MPPVVANTFFIMGIYYFIIVIFQKIFLLLYKYILELLFYFQKKAHYKETSIKKVRTFMLRKATCLHLLITHFILFKNNSLSYELFIPNFRVAVNYIFLNNGLKLSTSVVC